jgi:hypothetical protein
MKCHGHVRDDVGSDSDVAANARESMSMASKISEFQRFMTRRFHGIAAALVWFSMCFWRSAFAVASGTILPGCLTQNVQYEVPRNYPPSIETPDTAQFPLNSVIQIPSELTVAGDGGADVSSVIRLQIDVRDPNLEQRLEYRVFVDFDPAMPRIDAFQPIPPASLTATDRLTRRVEILVPVTQLGRSNERRCHRIEVLVSSAFQSVGLRSPVEPGDLASATWWVARQDEGISTVVDMRNCQ